MIYKKLPSDWKDLQQKVADIFLDAGFFDVEVEKKLTGVRGESEVDVYAKDDRGFYICECKNWKKAVPKSVVQTFRTIIEDVGANKGYIISKKGFQSGAYLAATKTNTLLVDWYEFQSEMEDAWIHNMGKFLYKYVDPLFRFTDILVPRTLTDHLSKKDLKYFWKLHRNYGHLWSMVGTIRSPLSGLSSQKEIADECRKNFPFPLDLGVPMKNKRISIEDFDDLKNYIMKYTDEGVAKFRELTKKSVKKT